MDRYDELTTAYADIGEYMDHVRTDEGLFAPVVDMLLERAHEARVTIASELNRIDEAAGLRPMYPTTTR